MYASRLKPTYFIASLKASAKSSRKPLEFIGKIVSHPNHSTEFAMLIITNSMQARKFAYAYSKTTPGGPNNECCSKPKKRVLKRQRIDSTNLSSPSPSRHRFRV